MRCRLIPMSTETPSIQSEIRQTQPFRSRADEAAIALLRTADVVRRRIGETMAPFGITMQQYNVLRILRGAGSKPLPTLEIAERMIEEAPGITRLLDRIEAKGWVQRTRCKEDRRQVLCSITPQGLDLLASMDEAITRADHDAIGDLEQAELKELIGLLGRVRATGH
jgi:DNA-binding MarR family transcriptional regulator